MTDATAPMIRPERHARPIDSAAFGVVEKPLSYDPPTGAVRVL